MPCSFAGVNLHLGDPGGAVQAWIDRYRPLEDLVPVCVPAAYCDNRAQPQSQQAHAIGLPKFNWVNRPPRWRINSLWWPNGASRFAIGLFLTTLSKANAIQAAIANTTGGGTLVMSDGTRSISATMWALPMRPIGAVGTDNPVVLLPLVDIRYFWQWINCGQLLVGPTSTWEDVRTRLTAQIGVTVTQRPDPVGYPAPDWSEWVRYYENAALAIDGYAATIGQRFVASLNGSYQFQKADDALSIANSNLSNLVKIAGGECLTVPGIVPRNVAVAFQRRQGGIVYQNGVCDLVTKPASDYGFTNSAPGTAVIHTTFQADYSGRSGAQDNLGAMSSLADSIARDFYGWKQKQYSATARALASSWTMTGFDDYLWFMLGTQVGSIDPCDCDDEEETEAFRSDVDEKPSPYLAQTLVESLPPNFGVQENLAQAPSPGAPRTFRPMPIFRGQLTTDFQAGVNNVYQATARLLYGSDYPSTGVLAQDGFDVKIFDTLNLRGQTGQGSKVWLSALASDTEMFELVSSLGQGSDTVVFQLTNILPLGNASTAVVCQWNNATLNYEPTAQAITVVDPFTNPGCWQGFIGYKGIGRLRSDGVYDVVFMERPALIVEYQLYTDLDSQTGFATADVLSYYQQGDKKVNTTLPYQVPIFDPLNLNQNAKAGQKGLAVWNDTRGRYEFLGVPSPGAQIRVFSLFDDLVPGGEAPAFLCSLVAGVWGPLGGQVTVTDRYHFGDGLWRAKKFHRGLCFQAPDGKYDVIFVERYKMFVQFIVTEDSIVVGPQSYQVSPIEQFQLGHVAPPLNSGQELTVWDEDARFPRGRKGCVGLAVYDDVADKYRVVMLEQQALLIKGTLTSALNADAGQFHLDGVKAVSCAPLGFLSALQKSTGLTATNTFKHRAKSGDEVLAVLDDDADDYVIIDVAKKLQKIPFDIRLKADKTQIEWQQTDCAVEYATDPVWADKVPIGTC